MKYYIIAGEASGDLHGSNLMKDLYAEDPKADIRFWGGDLMASVWHSFQNNPSHDFVAGPSPCGQGGSTVLNTTTTTDTEFIDAKGGFVMPCFCDSHTHIVYAGCRDGEFRDKIAGLSYEEIAAIVGISAKNVSVRLVRIREQLKKMSNE